ncbi:phosphogluconate dehydratase [Luteibacter aegosomaticola]|uniref:phosphogluconate dehydratase n=1 Tax=Luteibacter aegosomaticola TaxID=2911538 RepID=UPI001FFA800D|nr:phosphogluconate dehydratase [Luteibacter aegosomaticola]UPG90075.1 phosphogluconate dehydratase [Luteibacter aegosomaticola]
MTLHPVLAEVTQRIAERSHATRAAYLAKINPARGHGAKRHHLSCGNLAHGFAASCEPDKDALRNGHAANIAIVTAYNDMLSAHQPYEGYPERIRAIARRYGATAQVAGGVPAMCDGVTQGRPGMELSLFSRDLIAMATAVSLSHDMYEGALYLGICDKIVPGMLIGALSFGHLASAFVPSGPMPSGIPNEEKSKVRQAFAAGKATRAELLEAEARSYHGAGTCTFYGTANSNQMLMEIMGVHLPGSSFELPDTPLRHALTEATVERVLASDCMGEHYMPIGHIIDERAIVNGVVGLHATGGSTNHLLHLVAIARAAGIELRWDDFDALSSVVPLLARVYPNGYADVNHFHDAGGMGFLMDQLLSAGLLHNDVNTIMGHGLAAYRKKPVLEDGKLTWVPVSQESGNRGVLRAISEPFRADGGLRMLKGNLGRGVIKISSVPEDRMIVEAPAIVFDEQDDVKVAFDRGELNRDFIAVVRFQGPRARGMPELHKLTPTLSLLQDRGYRVALVTDGRMSGASGRVPAAIHVTPEAEAGGPIARIRTGDLVRVDAVAGTVEALVDADEWNSRVPDNVDLGVHHSGMGRELFAMFRQSAVAADLGAGVF